MLMVLRWQVSVWPDVKALKQQEHHRRHNQRRIRVARGLPLRIFQKLPHSADVVIIGSGMAGASVAYTLLREYQAMGVRKRVIILEARQICSGATGRNGGHIKASPYHAYSQYKARFGAAHAKKLCNFQLLHLPTFLSIAEHEGLVDAEVRSVQTLDVFTDTTMWQKAQIMIKELRADVPAMAEDIRVHTSATAQEVRFHRRIRPMPTVLT